MTIRHPVHIIQSSDLEENGGRYKLMGGAVIPVDHSTLAVASAANDHLAGGALTPVYFVTDAELATGRFKLMGGRSERIFNEHVFTGNPSRGIIGQAAIPVYDPNFSPSAPDWWNPLGDITCVWAAYQPVGAADFAASLVDQSGNGNNAGDPGGLDTPAWDAINGWTFDGISTFLTTTFTPQNDQSQSVLIQFSDVVAGDAFGMSSAAGNDFRIAPTFLVFVSYSNGNVVTVGPAMAVGNLGIAGDRGYRNGVAEGGAIGAWGGASAHPCFIGAYNAFGVQSSFCDGRIQALVLYDCIITAPQMLAVATAMAAL